MTQPAIQVENVGKRYQLGLTHAGSLRELVDRGVRRMVRRPANADSPPETPISDSIRDRVDPDGWFWALSNVSFEVQPGEVVGIIGRNGAGKSTLLKILSRITRPTSGRAVLDGRSASLLEVGTGFHPELTGRENVYMNATIYGMSRREIDRRFDEIVAFAGVEKFIDTPVKRYSSGMHVRLGFAVAAHLETDILIVDEVLAVGDAEFQSKCLGKIETIGNSGRTVLIVSHNLPIITNQCHRAFLLEAGQIQCEGPPGDVVRTYLADTRSTPATVSWELAKAPGNASLRLLAVRLLQGEAARPTADIDIAQEFMVEIVYRNLAPGQAYCVNIWLKDDMGSFVLSSANAPSMSLSADEWYRRPHPLGTFRTQCRIPGNLLNEGRYNIGVLLGPEIGQPWVREESLLSFMVHDTGEMRREYTAAWIGLVRPKLAWQTVVDTRSDPETVARAAASSPAFRPVDR